MRFLSTSFRWLGCLACAVLVGCAIVPTPASAPASLQANQLVGIDWIVTTIEGVAQLQHPRPRLRWNNMDRFSGSGGCNAFHGQALITGQTVRVVALVPVGKPCMAEPGSQEDRFFKALENAYAIRIESGQLHLLSEDGRVVLRLARAVGSP